MGKLYRLIKVNILSILALPLLLLATVVKMTEKSLGKIKTIFLMLAFSGAVIAVIEIISDPSIVVRYWKASVAFLSVICLVIIILRFMFNMASFVVRIVMLGITTILGTIYKLMYMGYMSMASSAESDYSYLVITGPALLYAPLCIFFQILRLVNILIQAFIRISLLVFILLSGGIAYLWYENIARSVQNTLGISMLSYLGRFDTWSLISNVIIFFVCILDIAVVLISLGIEWTQWSKELTFDEADQDRYMDLLEDDEEVFEEIEVDQDDESFEYYEIISDHLGGAGNLMEESREALAIDDNPLIESACNEYFKSLSEITGTIAEYRGDIPKSEFNKLKPYIKYLDRQRDMLYNLIDKQYEALEEPAKNAIFFTGCNTKEKLNKRYKALCRAYHPDNEGGDEQTFIAINEEYEKLKARFEINEEQEIK